MAIIQIIGTASTSAIDDITMYISLRPTKSLAQPIRGTVAKPTRDEVITTPVPTLGASSSTAVM